MTEDSLYWADQLAEKVIEEFPDQDTYVCASGISPSGIVHAGNLREIITTDFVVKALKRKGKNVRFIYSWDDYDRFRKVPANVPSNFEQYIGLPLSKVPSPEEGFESYADYFESRLENELEGMHMDIEFIYQTEKFESSDYADLIKQAMQNREKIREILNQYRREPLEEDWYPLRIYCKECNKDFTEIEDYNGEYRVEYYCEECEEDQSIDFKENDSVKPPWRVDWPMRWKYEEVAFEPGGKDHSAAGSSRDTGKEIVEEVYETKAPVYQMYDFIKPKGGDKKISSSAGENTLTLTDLKDIYTPEVVRFLFSETKPNKDFSIPFEEDVFQIYERFDKIEDAYFNPEKMENERKKQHWKRVYEIAMVNVPDEKPVRVPFQHSAFVAQTVPEGEWSTKAVESLKRTGHVPSNISDKQVENVLERLEKAKTWAREHAPAEYHYSINYEVPEDVVESLNDEQRKAAGLLADKIEEGYEDQDDFDSKIFEVKKQTELGTGEYFRTMYNILLSRDQGPRLSRLIMSIGNNDTVEILRQV